MRNVRAISIAGVQPRDPSSVGMFPLYHNDNLAGVEVNENTAFNISAFWNGIQMIGGSFASCEAIFQEKQGNSWVKIDDHPTGSLVCYSPNSEMTPFSFFEAGMAHDLSWGNAYAEIEVDGRGNPIGLWPITPNRVTPMRDKQGQLYYSILMGGSTPPAVLMPERMLHIPGLGFDGLVGYNVIRIARQGLGLTMAAEQYGASFFGNGTHPNGVLTTDQKMGEQAVENIRDCWNEKHQGLPRAHRTAILHSGYKFQQIAVNPADVQFLESRKFQIEEIARWLNIPPHLLKHLDRSTNNNIEQQSLEYVTYTMRPWNTRWKQELLRKLVRPELRYKYRFDFDTDPLVRGDFLSHMKAMYIGRQASIFNSDECRARLNMNPIPDGLGQEYIKPVNYVGVDDGETGILQPGVAK